MVHGQKHRSQPCRKRADSATFRPRLDESPGDPDGGILEQTMRMASRIISERAFEFSCRIVRLCDRLWKRGFKGRKIADQLFDAGTSIGANSEEAEGPKRNRISLRSLPSV